MDLTFIKVIQILNKTGLISGEMTAIKENGRSGVTFTAAKKVASGISLKMLFFSVAQMVSNMIALN